MAKLPNNYPPGEVAWEGDLPAPVTTYASARAGLPMHTRSVVPASTGKTGSAVVDRRDTRNGIDYYYSHGGIPMPLDHVLVPGGGGVRESQANQWLVQLHDWVLNRSWFRAGYPRNLGYSFRTPQLSTERTGGPTKAAMQQAPIFPKVQTVRRPSVTPPRYPTKGASS